MSVLDKTIRSRRSIRKFKIEPPPEEALMKILQSASFAPSPSNLRPVRYFGINSVKLRNEIEQKIISGKRILIEQAEKTASFKKSRNLINVYFRYSEFMLKAPWLIAAGTVKCETFSNKLKKKGINTPQKPGNEMDVALGASLQNFMLKATELGIGTCILTAPLTFADSFEEIFKVKDFTLKCFIAAGYTDETPGHIERIELKELYREL